MLGFVNRVQPDFSDSFKVLRWVKSSDAMYSGNNFIQFKDERLVLTSDSKRCALNSLRFS